MGADDYEYRGLIARSWDFLRGDTTKFPDRDFYRQFITQSGEPALIVGCGTGRLLLEYLGDGLAVEGMDISPEMLAICRQKAKAQSLQVTLYTQPMEAMDLPRRFRAIIVPSSSFQLVPEPGEARRALEAFARHLLPGGRLVFSIWHIKTGGSRDWSDWYLVAERDRFEGEKGIRRWERSQYDPATQLRYTENRYELVDGGEVVYEELHRRTPELRDYTISQLTTMLETAGFADVRAFSGFSDKPASEDDEVFCISGVRK